jgi:hypothetical protein
MIMPDLETRSMHFFPNVLSHRSWTTFSGTNAGRRFEPLPFILIPLLLPQAQSLLPLPQELPRQSLD